MKFLEHEGLVPYCPKCHEFRFPIFSCAISVIILNKDKTKTLFVKQYNTNYFRLVAGYVNKGESAEEALVREMKEEIGVEPIEYHILKTAYFSKSNTLIINFYALIDCEITPNYEIDSYQWFSLNDGIDAIKDAKLASKFYNYFLNCHEN